MGVAIALALLLLALALLCKGWSYWAWALPCAAAIAWWASSGVESPILFWTTTLVFVALAAFFGIPALRRAVVTPRLLRAIAPILPRMSDTEREALEAGTVWWDAELFSGKPDWKELLAFRSPPLTAEERAFLDGPAEDVCRMTNDWDVARRGDLPPEVWAFLKQHRFFGMIVPQRYGGLGFSAVGHSAVVTKLSSRSVVLGVTAMIPNSLGPAELILHYGTDEQKSYWLPRLARGEEVPCFALTEPGAGSDAGSMTSRGVVCHGEYRGARVLGIRLNWDKRYITLSSVSTLLGLAVKLFDPDGLLGGEEEVGITCILVPADLPGVEIGRRHDPLGVPFHNGPTTGTDVFVPVDNIIGGAQMAGVGWRMLMQTLAAGRGISLPSMAAAACQACTRGVSAYASVREQFGLPIGRFEGVEEVVARIVGRTYFVDATRLLTLGAIDQGQKPSVLTAIAKRYLTEAMRQVVNDSMDIVGGAGIVRGPRNMIAPAYQAVPVAITVEGANILTRSMIVFGQGALRCHPFAQREITAAAARDVDAFDEAFFGHVGFVFTNAARSFLLGLSGGSLAPAPIGGPMGATFSDLTRMSAAFALLSDVCMGTLGGSLKFREALTGRLADALSWMYIASATLKRFVDDEQPQRDLPIVRWCTEHALVRVQEALLGVLDNLPMRPVAWLLRPVLFPLGARFREPDDRLGAMVARAVLDGGEARDSLTPDAYRPDFGEPGLGTVEAALQAALAARGVRKKLREAVHAKQLDKEPAVTLVDRAVDAGVLDAKERELVRAAAKMRDAAIAVDAFDPGQYVELPA